MTRSGLDERVQLFELFDPSGESLRMKPPTALVAGAISGLDEILTAALPGEAAFAQVEQPITTYERRLIQEFRGGGNVATNLAVIGEGSNFDTYSLLSTPAIPSLSTRSPGLRVR